jgi:hypothetical protein
MGGYLPAAGRPAEKFGRDYAIKEGNLKLVQIRKPGRPRKTQASQKRKP